MLDRTPVRGDAAACGAREGGLEERFERRAARVAVVGLGSVGLPLAVMLWRAGFGVVGIERDGARLARIRAGRSPLHHFPETAVRELVTARPAGERGGFVATDDARAVAGCDATIVCVPTPLAANDAPDLSLVRAACDAVAPHLARGSLLVLESTTYPGTTREEIGAVLAAHGRASGDAHASNGVAHGSSGDAHASNGVAQGSNGAASGADVLVAYSPERQDPGGVDPLDANVPKLVGGTCAASARAAAALYRATHARVHVVASAEVAEAAKLVENAFRAVNIALVNELKIALDAMGLDVTEVLDAAATKPFGFMAFAPGPGTGGPCIPIDPHYLSWAARRAGARTQLVELATAIDRGMPRWVLERIERALATHEKGLAGARILLAGLAYKPEVDIVSESPALALWRLLEAAGARVEYTDPHVPRGPGPAATGGLDLRAQRSVALDEAALGRYDAVVLVTHHRALDLDLLARAAPLVVDTRAALASRMAGDARYFRA